MTSPARRRELVAWTREASQLAERRACRAIGMARSSVRYVSQKPEQPVLRARIRELAAIRIKAGYQTIWALLRREGWQVNKKRIHRLYREEGLTLDRKRPKRHKSASARAVQPRVTGPDQVWAMDFMHDQLADGRTLRVLTIVDAYTRECVVLEAKRTFTGSDVAVALSAAGRDRALPSRITCDNGSEFTARAVDHWAYWNRVTLIFSRPGKPTDNGLIEAFNGTLRRECLSPTLFTSIEDAQTVLNTWRADYNNVRPHSSLQHLPPAHFRVASSLTEDRSGRLVSHA